MNNYDDEKFSIKKIIGTVHIVFRGTPNMLIWLCPLSSPWCDKKLEVLFVDRNGMDILLDSQIPYLDRFLDSMITEDGMGVPEHIMNRLATPPEPDGNNVIIIKVENWSDWWIRPK